MVSVVHVIVLWLLVGCCEAFVPTPVSAAGNRDPSEVPQKKPVPPDHIERMRRGTDLFRNSVREILRKQCLDCHGGAAVKGDFDLSRRETLFQSGSVAATAAESRLLQLITHADEPHMPLQRPKLQDQQIELIRRWIDFGAPYDKPLADQSERTAAMVVTDHAREFWSFRRLSPVDLPDVKNSAWCRTPIDRFVLTRQETEGIVPNPPAARRALIRRAYYDLLGLPPTPEDVATFLTDQSPDAWHRVIDRLLDSPHYGERMARHWMDVARFAESHGYEHDTDRPTAWHYRDFLIQAFNADMPYQQFVQWQLAGDELAPDDPLALAATGFLAAGAFPTQLTETEFESARCDELDDIVTTTGVAFLGLTLGCARCHDHKFDPIPTVDYYRMVDIFRTAVRTEVELGPATPFTDTAARTVARTAPPQNPNLALITSEGLPPLKHKAESRGYPYFYPETWLLKRGDVHQKQQVVSPGFLQVLMPAGADSSRWQTSRATAPPRTSQRRSALAAWITDAEIGAGSLTARVIVNRMWQCHFGRGLVATPNDFGTSGDRPTHPELLDWLATSLMQNNGSLKQVHRLIMQSSVYQQSAEHDPVRGGRDRENQLYWRWTPRRLEAEPIRDAMLAVSGQLDETQFGPGSQDADMSRRSVYFFIKRSQLIPAMMLFDWPEHLVSIGRRPATTVAPQALMFLNGPQARRYAEGLAARLPTESAAAAVVTAWQISCGRSPEPEELRRAVEFLARQETLYRDSGRPNGLQAARTDFCQTLLSMNEFLYID